MSTGSVSTRKIDQILATLDVLIVDDNAFMRKLVRTLLANLGVKGIQEAADGLQAVEVIRSQTPDVVILDWEMPLISGAEVMRIIRKPTLFPVPDVPVIMLTAHVERWRVTEALKLGVNEFIAKPVSGKVLLERIASIVLNPRPMIDLDGYYGPEPRRRVGDTHRREKLSIERFVAV